ALSNTTAEHIFSRYLDFSHLKSEGSQFLASFSTGTTVRIGSSPQQIAGWRSSQDTVGLLLFYKSFPLAATASLLTN
ncbi:MAG: hypothetical protein M3X11_02465, partial [Acidobacteriota bacterium]|nr:hypothetical protein [Acidobacteriota bacterium]